MLRADTSTRTPDGSAIAVAVRTLVAPWSFTDRSPDCGTLGVSVLAALNVAAAAVLATVLSTWTYLIGKGLLMTVREMDMGMDDLPADSVRQVAFSFAASLLIWAVLLAVAILIAIAVADWLYRDDRVAFGIAVRRTAAATLWFVVWSMGIIVANAIHHDEIRHPAAAVRSYAQLNQHWFHGSSAMGPGPIEHEPLIARGRLRILAAAFPLLWALTLPVFPGKRRPSRALLVVAAILLSWIAWAAVWRLLPWTVLETFAG